MSMTMKRVDPSFPRQESGAALVTGLIFLVVLTMMGVTAARMSTLEERMSGNMRDRSVAMQAAELALRDAERDIRNAVAGHARNISGLTDFSADCGAASADTDDDGLCYSGPGVATTIIDANGFHPDIATTTYGEYTNADPISGLDAQPAYVIEGIRKMLSGGDIAFYYRITTRAQGANPNTVVWLQEVFRP